MQSRLDNFLTISPLLKSIFPSDSRVAYPLPRGVTDRFYKKSDWLVFGKVEVTQVGKKNHGPAPTANLTGDRVALMQLRYVQPKVFSHMDSLKAWHYWIMRSLLESPDLR